MKTCTLSVYFSLYVPSSSFVIAGVFFALSVNNW